MFGIQGCPPSPRPRLGWERKGSDMFGNVRKHSEMFGTGGIPSHLLLPWVLFLQMFGNVRKMFGIGGCTLPLRGNPLSPTPQRFGNVRKCSEMFGNVRKMFGKCSEHVRKRFEIQLRARNNDSCGGSVKTPTVAVAFRPSATTVSGAPQP